MKKLILLCTAIVCCGAGAAETASFQWPELPTSGFVSGRPATNDDVEKGNAISS